MKELRRSKCLMSNYVSHAFFEDTLLDVSSWKNISNFIRK